MRNSDRPLLQTLYEDWIQSAEDWHQSAIYMRTQETKTSRKRGRMVYKTYIELVDKFGSALAKQIREQKYTLQNQLKEGEEPWWLPHPELGSNKDSVTCAPHYTLRVSPACACVCVCVCVWCVGDLLCVCVLMCLCNLFKFGLFVGWIWFDCFACVLACLVCCFLLALTCLYLFVVCVELHLFL